MATAVIVGDAVIAALAATRFHNVLYVQGSFHRPTDPLTSLTFPRRGRLGQTFTIDPPDESGVQAFRGQALFDSTPSLETLVRFSTRSRWRTEVRVLDLALDRQESQASVRIVRAFIAEANLRHDVSVLDLGGRDRMGDDAGEYFDTREHVTLDIVPGMNVDVVADAHSMAEVVGEDRFDYVYSTSVFEHLAMPWLVVLELNRVMRTGGRVLIHAPHSVGLHDFPWDYWRFSDTAWDALFNEWTGFRILDRSLDHEVFLVPFAMHPRHGAAEDAAGFEASVVVAEKIGPARLDWPVPLAAIAVGTYPGRSPA